jgi:AcrR family transcriptional regulator
METAGLRERNKARRKAAIIRAALGLFAERGYHATTIADIAAEADVAPRTVAMYFPSKQDIALSPFSEAVDELTRALSQRRPGETVTQIMGQWLRASDRFTDTEFKRLAMRMFEANPELDALRATRMAAAIRAGAEAIARETGAPPDSPGPRIAAAAAAASLIAVIDTPSGSARDEATTAALRFLDAGIGTLVQPLTSPLLARGGPQQPSWACIGSAERRVTYGIPLGLGCLQFSATIFHGITDRRDITGSDRCQRESRASGQHSPRPADSKPYGAR